MSATAPRKERLGMVRAAAKRVNLTAGIDRRDPRRGSACGAAAPWFELAAGIGRRELRRRGLGAWSATAKRVDLTPGRAPEAHEEGPKLEEQILLSGSLWRHWMCRGTRRGQTGRSESEGEEKDAGGGTESSHERLLSRRPTAAAGMAAARGLPQGMVRAIVGRNPARSESTSGRGE